MTSERSVSLSLTCFLGLADHDVRERTLAVAVDCLHHHLVLAELAQSPEAEMESCFVPVKTIKIKEMEWSLQAGMGCSLMKLFRLTL